MARTILNSGRVSISVPSQWIKFPERRCTHWPNMPCSVCAEHSNEVETKMLMQVCIVDSEGAISAHVWTQSGQNDWSAGLSCRDISVHTGYAANSVMFAWNQWTKEDRTQWRVDTASCNVTKAWAVMDCTASSSPMCVRYQCSSQYCKSLTSESHVDASASIVQKSQKPQTVIYTGSASQAFWVAKYNVSGLLPL
jgi:hypothetical protein